MSRVAESVDSGLSKPEKRNSLIKLLGKFPVVLQKMDVLRGDGPYAQYFDVMLNSIGFAEVDP